MVFSNEVACKEEAEGGGCDRAAQQEADSKGNDEPEKVVVHNEPQTLEKTPLFSAITYYEGGQKVYGGEFKRLWSPYLQLIFIYDVAGTLDTIFWREAML